MAGLGEHGIADQAGFVLAIAEAAPGVVGAVAEFAEHVVGAEEAREGGELGVGLDQVMAGRVGIFDEQTVLAFGHLEVGRGGGVDRGEGGAGVVHGNKTATRCGGDHRQYATRRLGTGVIGVGAQVDIDATDRDAGLVIAQGAGQLCQGVFVQRAVLRLAGDFGKVDRTTGLKRSVVLMAAVGGPSSDVACVSERQAIG